MPKRLSLQPPRTLDAWETRFRRATDSVVRRHWQALWRLAPGWAAAQGAAIPGDTVHGVRTLARRSTHLGPAGLADHRHHTPGAAGLLSAAQRAALVAAREPPPPAGGVWTGPTAAAWLAATLGRHGPPHRGWATVRRWGWTSKVPRPRHATAAPTAPAAFTNTAQRPSRRAHTPIRRTPSSWGRRTHTAWGSSPSCAGSGALGASAPRRSSRLATRGALATPWSLRMPVGPGGCGGRPCRPPRSRSPGPSWPPRWGRGRASRSWRDSSMRAGMPAPKSLSPQGYLCPACPRMPLHGSRLSGCGRSPMQR
jgi:hypothetical protein